MNSLSKLCSTLGIPLKTDQFTKNKTMIRGLNWPNKQVDVYIFLQLNKVGLLGLFETKVKEHNVDTVASRAFPGWRWVHNFSLNPRGRIWVAWKPSIYHIKLIYMTEQFIHCHAMHMSLKVKFYITFVYGLNQLQQRKQMWSNLSSSQPIQEPWCIIGDFNSILYKEDRIGGGDVLLQDIKDMNEFMDSCEMHEMRSIGPYYSWTNKTIMSRIDRALINEMWSIHFNFTQVRYKANSLSDHTPLVVQFLPSPKPKPRFQYCDMWAKHPYFLSSISASLPSPGGSLKWKKLKHFLDDVRVALQHLHRSSFHDLKEQQELARKRLTHIQLELLSHPHHKDMLCEKKEAREHYNNILSSSITLLQQQCKQEWIKYGDSSSKLFFAKTKQRKLSSYIYPIKDESGTLREGFEEVGNVMVSFYRKLLGPQPHSRSPLSREILNLGPLLSREQQVDLCRPFTEKDVKQALFSIPNTKSPGPDGFSSGFFK
ncbi:hypothetical protein Cgig2_023901 [Carnegiea gigantea]|uniref:Endonuclease/exonuclease/phosphatase domain-containing protein n=1 Tax=Carnegiea gigantea TaxID=171969 RepID=A0A9Q1GRT8_9CARY|nr:hypothetical protein Cgig2_023901 [Carnegiea gigantea]